MIRNVVFAWSRLVVLGLLFLPAGIPTAVASAKTPIIAKWGRFEHVFKSAVSYTNPVQGASLKVLFTSPLGDACEVDGFWDGGKTWRVRFSPDQPGRWTFKTICSDAANDGLDSESGEFLCTAATGPTRFHKHGPVRVSLNHRYLEHADGTPFFWLADTVWAGPRAAELKDWQFYTQTRASERFTVAQWAAAPGEDAKKQSPYYTLAGRLVINPDYFQRLDARLDVLSQAGILSAISPLLELPTQKVPALALSDDQAALLVRYVVARWGAEPVAWLLAFEGDTAGKNARRWKRIGQAVFGSRRHAPVVLCPGETQYVFDDFRNQPWVDVFGYQSVTDVTDDAVKWAVAGPFAAEWKQEPARPLVIFAPCENGAATVSGRRFSSDDVRHAIYWSLLLTPPAGISYAGLGVVNWDVTVGPKDERTKAADLPMWRKSMFMPGAKQVSSMAKFVNSVDFWTLRPQPKAVVSQPGNVSPQRFIAAAGTEPNILSLVYVPEDRTIEVMVTTLPATPVVGWFNPRTGENHPAVAVVGGSSCQFPTPEAGDWLLVLKAGK